jgi:hypothetical protein
MPQDISGLELARTFYRDAVEPLLDRPHAAALIGEGSEVLGYDDARSRDHEWGPRLQVFVHAADVDSTRKSIAAHLPAEYAGYPTQWFSLLEGRSTHHIEVASAEQWLAARIPSIPWQEPDAAAWLSIPQQHLLQLTAGELFRDDLGDMSRLRAAYAWYPLDVWRWMIAAHWHLLGNIVPIIGRALECGDRRGARLHIGRTCELMIEMAFLQERRYRPYAKWLGRAFGSLAASASLGPLLDRALQEVDQAAISDALLLLAHRHDGLRITEEVAPAISDFAVGINDAVRPYPVLNTSELIDATVSSIEDPRLRELPRVGSIDQLTHADDLLINFTTWPAELAAEYRRQLGAASPDG